MAEVDSAVSTPADATEPHVLIVGAGPTGLVLALWLVRAGVRVRIIDRNAGSADFSRALGVQARTLELYQQLGIADRVVENGVIVRGANLWVERRRAARIPLHDIGRGMTPFPFVVDYAQNDHERMLIDELALHGMHVERNTSLESFEQNDQGVSARLAHADGSREECRAQYIAGCDGAHSRVREILGIPFDGGTYEQLFYVADAVASEVSPADEIHIDLDSADLLALFPMKGKGHIRLVGTVLGREPEGMTFDNAAREPIARMSLEVDRVNWFSPYRVHHRVAARFREGRAFLLGDAAHIHSPVGAQGMNTGIGDAINLAWKIAAVVKQEATPWILDSYEPERIAFARKLVATTDRAFTFAIRRGAVARIVRRKIFPRIAAAIIRTPATRRFAFRTVSQLAVNYRESALSSGSAGKMQAGDRLPWIADVADWTATDGSGGNRGPSGVANAAGNFAALKSRDWQVHVYGAVNTSSDIRETCTELGLTLHDFRYTNSAKAAGVQEGAIYLVRPDGYIGFAGPPGDTTGLRVYRSRV